MSDESLQRRNELLQFPADYPIKVMGRMDDGFAQWVLAVVQRHAPDFDPASLEMKPSTNGRFVSVTAVFRATSKAQLDALYREITADERVLFSL